MKTLQTAGEAMESLEKTLDLVARQAVEIERKTVLLRQSLEALTRLRDKHCWSRWVSEDPSDTWRPASQYGLDAIDTITKELAP